MEFLYTAQVTYIDVSYNEEMDEDSIHMLSAILSKHKPVTIIMQGCDLTESELSGFEEYDGVTVRLKLSHFIIYTDHTQSLITMIDIFYGHFCFDSDIRFIKIWLCSAE